MLSLNELSLELNFFTNAIKENVAVFTKIIAGIWLFNILNWCTGSKLNYLGIIPRRFFGLLGILTGTFLHKHFNHLFFNSIPLVALGLVILSFGLKAFFYISLFIMLTEGFSIWLIARPGIHIGTSSLISGYFSFILISAYCRPNITSILVAIITIYYFGSIILSIFPSEEKISWEGHLFGFIAGILAYYVFFQHLVL